MKNSKDKIELHERHEKGGRVDPDPLPRRILVFNRWLWPRKTRRMFWIRWMADHGVAAASAHGLDSYDQNQKVINSMLAFWFFSFFFSSHFLCSYI